MRPGGELIQITRWLKPSLDKMSPWDVQDPQREKFLSSPGPKWIWAQMVMRSYTARIAPSHPTSISPSEDEWT